MEKEVAMPIRHESCNISTGRGRRVREAEELAGKSKAGPYGAGLRDEQIRAG